MRILPRASATSAITSQVKDDSKSSKRPTRAAAVAVNAGITRQVQDEDKSFLASCTAKKRPSATTATATSAKKSRVSTTKSLKVVERKVAVAGKKRAQAVKYENAQEFEAAPVMTELPPLPFASSATSKFEVKREGTSKTTQKFKAKTKANHSWQQIGAQDGRSCEFCRKVANICALLHCTACRRVYHAKCLVNTFKPYVDVHTPILDQIERLRAEAPERRGNIFRQGFEW